MGGFKPSRADIAGSTIVGSDKDVDVHQFTGSVNITGSLLINGVQITQNGGGGGGGSPGGANTQVQFNDGGNFGGSANFTFDGNAITVSDDADVTNTFGRVKIGYDGTNSDYATFAHRDNATNVNFALQQRADGTTVVNAKSGQSLSLRMGNANALVVAGASNNNVGINTGSPTARLHVSASSVEKDALRIDGDGDKHHALVVNGDSGHVGLGTEFPNNPLEVFATASQQRWSYDTGDNNFATMTVSSTGDMTLSGSNYATASLDGGEIHLDAAGKILLQSDGGQFQFQRPGNTNRFIVDTSAGNVFLTNIQNTSTVIRGLTNQTTQLTIDPVNTRLLLPTTHSVAFRDANTTIHSIAANNLRITAPGTVGISNDLEITGSLTFGGTEVTSTAAELNLLDAGATQHTASVLAAIPKLAKATYDFAEFGGGQSTFTLTGVTIPDNAMIVGGWVDTETNPASAGAATIAFGMTLGGVTDMFLGATAFNQFASEAGGQLIPVNQATPAQYMKMAGASTLTCTIGGANLTAGKLHIYLQYVVGA
jgi:hypothetical protein